MRPVVWSAEARRDILSALRYIAAENPAAAVQVVDAIEATGHALGKVATGRSGRVAGTYEKSLSGLPYVMAYELRPIDGVEAVVILRVIHTSRNWPKGGWPAS